MTPDNFVSLIKEAVEVGAKDDVIENLKEPPGRKPDPELLKNSEWYLSLDEKGKERVKSIISDSISETIFGFLSVLDGVRSISESGEENSLELHHKDKGKRTLLNDQSKEYLHDMYKNT
ncbi:MAG: hypothetical protein OEY11_04200 [Gammaproteobacteria bacterium]|nr:hypothetical protein [Gammaproteobacteria bacterium]